MKMKRIYALTYEYSYANNMDGRHSPEDAGGILGLFEDKDDAKAEAKKQTESGDWGDFSDEDAVEKNCGWSLGGYILSVEEQKIVPSSKGAK